MPTPSFQYLDVTRATNNIVDTLRLDRLFVVSPGGIPTLVDTRISVLSVFDCPDLDRHIETTVRLM